LPHLVAHINGVVEYLTSQGAAWEHPAWGPGAALLVPPRRRDSALRLATRDSPPSQWRHTIPCAVPADLGRLFASQVIVGSLRDDVTTWDWSPLLPALRAMGALRAGMHVAALERPEDRTDPAVASLVDCAREDRNFVKHDNGVTDQRRAQIVERYLHLALLCGAQEDDPCVWDAPRRRDTNRGDRQLRKDEARVLGEAHSANHFRVHGTCGSGSFGCVFKV
jgi:hypothetical protein